MPFRIRDLTPESIEDALAYWLYSEDAGWERWRLVPGSAVVSASGEILRLTFELDGDSFDWVLLERESRFFARYDEHDEPEREFPARIFEGQDEAIILFVHEDQTIFVHLELEPS